MTDKTFGSSEGLTVLAEDQATPANGMVAYVTSSWNSGYQNGDIKGAFLSDTDDTDLVGSGELVTNGTFDTDTDWITSGGWSISGGEAFFASGSGNGEIYQDVSGLSPGKIYVAQVKVITEFTGAGIDVSFGVRNSLNSAWLSNVSLKSQGTGVFFVTFVAETSTHRVRIFSYDNLDGTIDNISVKLADADRSVNNNGLIVNGTITREPVAPGADLVAYSGFSDTNYLEMPYNPDLDFGTGDFCVMGWVNLQNDAPDHIFERAEPGSIANRFGMYISSSGEINLFTNTSVLSGGGASFGTWDFITMVRRSGTLEFYRGGALKVSQADTNNVTNANAVLAVGAKPDATSPLENGSLALLRISATAPTPEQIKRIYEDEKHLFQENAQATLYGSSDAVAALAHDPVTDLLHVGSSDGRSVFQGLRRVDNTTTPVNTAISASNNLIVED